MAALPRETLGIEQATFAALRRAMDCSIHLRRISCRRFLRCDLYHHSRQLVHHHSDGPGCYACDPGEEYSLLEILAACFGTEVFAADLAERAQLGDALFRNCRGAAECFRGRLKGVIR